VSIRVRIILSYLLIIGIGFYYLMQKIADPKQVKARYMGSVEDSMVDVARLFASLVGEEIRGGRVDPEHFREAFRRAAARPFVAQIYSKQKTTLDLHIYITDANGIVIFDSDGGRAEGQDYSRFNDVYLTLRGQYGARSTKAGPADRTSPCSTSARRSWTATCRGGAHRVEAAEKHGGVHGGHAAEDVARGLDRRDVRGGCRLDLFRRGSRTRSSS
jgi:hypothetical protein